jgi:hypothetical protein
VHHTFCNEFQCDDNFPILCFKDFFNETQWPKEKVQRDKQRSTKHYTESEKTNDLFTSYVKHQSQLKQIKVNE